MVYYDTELGRVIYAFQAGNKKQVLEHKDFIVHVLASILKALYSKRDFCG